MQSTQGSIASWSGNYLVGDVERVGAAEVMRWRFVRMDTLACIREFDRFVSLL